MPDADLIDLPNAREHIRYFNRLLGAWRWRNVGATVAGRRDATAAAGGQVAARTRIASRRASCLA
ncbi:hypothetical protein GALL_298510 [mine drainage metagenome]|jgi:hypothetical protein|uniref:Uncharacterized protein n=1 Tax=mine drainage metagenome TaxID=410659 RepID=A0A1J5QX45_9ZZZZ